MAFIMYAAGVIYLPEEGTRLRCTVEVHPVALKGSTIGCVACSVGLKPLLK